MSEKIFHITTPELWSRAQRDGIYSHPSLEDEGFIHASFESQVEGTLKKHFKGQTNLLLLELSLELIESSLKIEDLYDLGVNFPHIYSKIALEAVLKVTNINLSC